MAIDRILVLRTKAAADHVGLAASTLERYRQEGIGPRFVRIGRRAVGYRVTDLETWLDAGASPAETRASVDSQNRPLIDTSKPAISRS